MDGVLRRVPGRASSARDSQRHCARAPRIRDALRAAPHVCIETTGASPAILHDLLALAPPADTVVVRVAAPLELCLERIATRDPQHQIPMDADAIRTVHTLSVAAPLTPHLERDNLALSDDEIVARSAPLLGARASGRD